MLTTERRDHLDFLADRLRGFTKHLIVLSGGMGTKARREALGALNTLGNDEERLLLATGRYIGEGFDDSRLDTLFLTMPVFWAGNACAIRRATASRASREDGGSHLRLRRFASAGPRTHVRAPARWLPINRIYTRPVEGKNRVLSRDRAGSPADGTSR